MTAISPCWQDEGGTGQCPITALTRRHGYTRGHGMGPEGFTKIRDGRKIWFVSTNNEVIEVSVKGMFVRLHGEARDEAADYSIVLFNKDLPPSIEPMQVVQSAQLLTRFPLRYPASRFLLETEQGGHVSLQLPGFALATYKGGDSGSPDLLPLGNDLVFTGGRTTSGPTRTMQNDMDLLCRNAGIKPDKYQMQWVDLSAYPAY